MEGFFPEQREILNHLVCSASLGLCQTKCIHQNLDQWLRSTEEDPRRKPPHSLHSEARDFLHLLSQILRDVLLLQLTELLYT